MSIKAASVRKVLREAGTGRTFRAKLREMLGVCHDPKLERNYFDPSKAQVGADEFSVRELTEEFCGREFVSELHSGPLSDSRREALVSSRTPQARALFEDVAGVDPSAQQDINAWTATVAGLVEVKLLEGYNSPEFITDQLLTVMPRRQNGGKLIAIPYVHPNVMKVVRPGVEFPDAGLTQLYVWARPNMTCGAKIGLDREAVVYDLSGELMGSAESVGKSLKWAQEYVRFGGIYGLKAIPPGTVDQTLTDQIADSFRMGGSTVIGPDSTANPTYQLTAVTSNANYYNYVNQLAAGTIVDWTSLRSYRNLLNLMRDPANNLPFDTEIRDILVDPYYAADLQYLLHQSQVWRATGAAQAAPYQASATTTAPFTSVTPGAPEGVNLFGWSPHWSNIAHQVLLDSGISEANSQKYAIVGDPKKAFVWQQAWDMRVDQANPTDADMLSRNIVNLWVAQWSGQFCVREPRFCVRGTN